ncbi:hypothetical protein DAPPUDRAFT_244276 [Daphnia pulex]|uniref:Uncharacterized protein n=1 Tax=Daphnia pulex TaxID=6669 RepID=E9GKL1_DAPPU|nr:hypothetical protein DAPPUDRAFT_244276 [Daphnia pulex]|eukprot:EFX80010.1 hypothetical protein DAPPUDRAFT_244276 [Daphnia pulex]
MDQELRPFLNGNLVIEENILEPLQGNKENSSEEHPQNLVMENFLGEPQQTPLSDKEGTEEDSCEEQPPNLENSAVQRDKTPLQDEGGNLINDTQLTTPNDATPETFIHDSKAHSRGNATTTDNMEVRDSVKSPRLQREEMEVFYHFH